MARFVGRQAIETLAEKTIARSVIERVRDAARGHDEGEPGGDLLDHDYQLRMLRTREERITGAVARRLKAGMDDGEDPAEVFSRCQHHLLAAASAHAERIVLEALPDQGSSDAGGPRAGAALEARHLHALAEIERDRAWWIEHGRLSTERAKSVTRTVDTLCRELRPHAVTLVDALRRPRSPTHTGDLMALDFKHASLVEGVRFTAQVGVPNVVQGLFRKRPGRGQHRRQAARRRTWPTASSRASPAKYGPDPFWVRVGGDEALLLTHPDDIHTVLGGSPSPFASDPDAKRKGMTAFQPTALTISRGDLWADRRAFAEAVLQTGSPLHSLASTFAAVAAEEADALARRRRPLLRPAINAAFQRLTRRVVLGSAAADDTALTDQLGELMSAGNKMPGEARRGYDAFHARLAAYVAAPDPDALTGLVAAAPSSRTRPTSPGS
jgi:hypothetical protein